VEYYYHCAGILHAVYSSSDFMNPMNKVMNTPRDETARELLVPFIGK
jgi:hypothetical protein